MFELRDVDPLTTLYTGPESDNHWTYQGRFVLLAATALGASLTLGGIYLDFDIEFYIPQLAPEAGYMAEFGAVTPSSVAPFGTSQIPASWGNLPFKVNTAGDAIWVNAGYHTLSHWVSGSGITSGSDTFPMVITSGATKISGSTEATTLNCRGWVTFLANAAGWVTWQYLGTTLGSAAYSLAKGPLPSKIPAAASEVKEMIRTEIRAQRAADVPSLRSPCPEELERKERLDEQYVRVRSMR
jgi:hypothetical protein